MSLKSRPYASGNRRDYNWAHVHAFRMVGSEVFFMALVVASGEFPGGDILTFKAFPTHPYALGFVITLHVEGEVKGEVSYRVRKREEVIYETEPRAFQLPDEGAWRQIRHADSIQVGFPSQGSYELDFVFDGAVLHSLPFSVFDKSNRTDLEREIIYYLKAKRGPRTVEQITRGVINPRLLNKANIREYYGKIYFALLRMGEVVNVGAQEAVTLEKKMSDSRWQLRESERPKKGKWLRK